MKHTLMRVLKNDWRRELQNGDEVYWNDPDDDACSRTIKIRSIKYFEDDSVHIWTQDGGCIELFLHELS